jgi:hypothetical protein
MMKLTSKGRLVIPPDQKADSPPAPQTPKPAGAASSSPRVGAPQSDGAAKPPPPKINWHEMPEIEVVTAADLERVRLETEARRRRDMIAMFKIGAYCLLGVLLLAAAFETLRYVLNPRPGENEFAALKEDIGAQVLRSFTSGEQPLEIGEIEVDEVDRTRNRIDYELRVTLRLRMPLYAPADSNGAQPYLAMQRSLAESQSLVLQQRLFLENQELATAPEMPMLLAVTHRAGERRLVRVPVTATRSFWTWRVEPHPERARPIGAAFVGQALARYDAKYLIFGDPEARDRMRRVMADARRFILNVNAEHTRRMRGER